jgi:hypothetical protein
MITSILHKLQSTLALGYMYVGQQDLGSSDSEIVPIDHKLEMVP